MPMIRKTLLKISKFGIVKMVPRIFRGDICRPSRFHRPKFYALHCRLKSTSSDLPKDEVARCKKCQRTINHDFGSPQYNAHYNNLKIPGVLTHTTVFETGKGNDKNTITLMESLKQRIKTTPRNPQKVQATPSPAEQNESGQDELTIERPDVLGEKKMSKTPSFSLEESFVKATTDSDKVNEEKLIQRPEPIDKLGERRAVFDPPNLKSSYMRYSRYYEKQKEAQMFDELAKKYLRAEKGQIDKNLSQEMERLRLHPTRTTSQTVSPPIHVNIISCDTGADRSDEQNKISSEEISEAKSRNAETQKITAPNYGTPQYFNRTNWCNNYFNHYEKDENGEDASQYSNVESITQREYNEILPFRDYFDYIQPIPESKTYDIDTSIKTLSLDETQPLHFILQGTLIDYDNTNAPQTNVVVREHRDFIVPSEEMSTRKPIMIKDTGVINSLNIQDSDVTKYDYLLSHDFCNVYLNADNQEPMQPAGEIEPIVETQAQSIVKNEGDQNAKQAELLAQANVMGINMSEAQEAIDVHKALCYPFEETLLSLGTEPILQFETLNADQEQHDIGLEPLTRIDLMESSKAADTFVKMEETQEPFLATDSDFTKYDYLFPHDCDLQNISVNSWIGTQYKPMKAKINEKRNYLFQKIELPKQTAVKSEPVVQIQAQAIPKTEKKQNQTPKQHGQVYGSYSNPRNDNDLKRTEKLRAMETTQQPTRETQAMVQSCIQAQTMPKPDQEQISEQTEPLAHTNVLNPRVVAPADKPRSIEEPKQSQKPGPESQRCTQAQAIPKTELNQNSTSGPHINTPNTVDDVLTELNLDSNLSLTELLRRVRARNRLLYCNEVRTQMVHMSPVISSKPCPPTDRPQCPPPPDCSKPCPPASKPKCPPEPPKCPPEPEKPKCPPCPPPPPECPPKPKCPPDPPKCPPDPPCPCPCPCPPPPKCPPPPPKCCSCQATDPDLIAVLPRIAVISSDSALLSPPCNSSRNLIEIMKHCLIELRDKLLLLFSAANPNSDLPILHLNRVRDFEPWTPIPSWPYPISDNKKKLQCPYHGCPFLKPGPVRPNCPELPCGGFPKRLSFTEVNH